MAKDYQFFARLYSGFEAEYFVMGKLFGAGLEAFKLPADFGLDLLVTNQKELSACTSTYPSRVYPFPYAIQVKSRRAKKRDFRNGPGNRSELVIHFSLSESEFDLLCNEERAYLACVAFLPIDPATIGQKALYFWLKGSQLAQLQEHSYIERVEENGKAKYDLMAVFRLKPTQTKGDLIKRLKDAGHLTGEGAKELKQILPEQLGVNWNAGEYAALVRCPWGKLEGGYYGDRNVRKKLRREHLDFELIGTEVMFPTDDVCESFPKFS